MVHPFQDSINTQHKNNHRKIFSNKWSYEDILPDSELITFRVVQSLENNSNGLYHRFETLDYMKGEIVQIEFDVAIIGCGAYSFPLAVETKKMGK